MNKKEEVEVYTIKYPENYRAELIRSKLKIIDKTYTTEFISKNLIKLQINYTEERKVASYCIVYQIPSEFGNIDIEYLVGNLNKLYKEYQLSRSYKIIRHELDELFDVLDEGKDSIVKVFGPGSKELRNYVDFVNKLDEITADIVHDLPSILKNFY